MRTDVRTVRLSTGVRLEYAGSGDPTGVPVLLLHGYTDSWRSFEQVLDLMPATIRAVAPSQRGHGTSDRPPERYRGPDLAADAVALLDELGIDRAVVVGHSLGSWVAGHVAAGYPDRVLGTVLVGALGDPALLAGFAEVVNQLRDPVDVDFVREFQIATTAAPLPVDRLAVYVKESRKLPARIWRAVLRDFVTGEQAPAGTAPTLLVWGDRDGFVDAHERAAIAAAYPDAQVLVYPGVGHAVHWEAPERFAADLAGFAGRLTAVR